MMTRNEEIALHKAEQAAGLRPPIRPHYTASQTKKRRRNRKALIKHKYANVLDEYAAYLQDRLDLVHELQAERDALRELAEQNRPKD